MMEWTERKLRDLLDGLCTPDAPGLSPNDVMVISCIPILWAGWEGDHTAWILEIKSTGERKAIISAATADVVTLPDLLRDRINAYREATVKTERFLSLLDKVEPDFSDRPFGGTRN